MMTVFREIRYPRVIPLLMLLLGYFIADCCAAGQAAAFGKWKDCPANISTYAGCNVTLTAYFNVKDDNIMCSEAFIQFGVIDGNNNVQLKRSVSFGVNGSNDVCEVITVLDKVTPGVREVIFSAVRINENASNSLTCDDLLKIKDSLPFNGSEIIISKMITSVAVANITWSPPSSLYKPEDLEGYLVTIHDNQNITYLQMVTSENTITVNVTAGSCVQINAIYCGGQFSEHVLLPLISNEDQEIAGVENVVANLDCNLLHIEWESPGGSLQDHDINYYTISIGKFNLTILTEMTSIEVILNKTILSSLYYFEMNVTVTVCGSWSSKASIVGVDNVPVNFELVTYRMLVLNDSHGSVLMKSEACRGSYSVRASFECNSGMNVIDQLTVVNVPNDNKQVSLNYILPLNQTCNGIFTWNQNGKQYTFDTIIETLSPWSFTTNALHYVCLFECCDVYHGSNNGGHSGGCTSLENNFAVLTDDSACDGYFTLRCDNFTAIYNQTSPSKTFPISFISSIVTSSLSPTETSIIPACICIPENQSLVPVVIAVLLFVCLVISIVINIYLLKWRCKGTIALHHMPPRASTADEPVLVYYSGDANNPTVTIIDNKKRGSACDDQQQDGTLSTSQTSFNSTNGSGLPALMEDSDSESDDVIKETHFLLSTTEDHKAASNINKSQVSYEHEPSYRFSFWSTMNKIKRSFSDSELAKRTIYRYRTPSRTSSNQSIDSRQFTLPGNTKDTTPRNHIPSRKASSLSSINRYQSTLTIDNDDTKVTNPHVSKSSTKDQLETASSGCVKPNDVSANENNKPAYTMTYLHQLNTIKEEF